MIKTTFLVALAIVIAIAVPVAFSFAAEIVAPDTIKVGELLVVKGVTNGPSRWGAMPKHDGPILRTKYEIALIPAVPGQLRFTFTTAEGSAITDVVKLVEVVSKEPLAAPLSKPPEPEQPKVEPAPAKTVKTARENPFADLPALVMYSMPPAKGDCPACEKWLRSEYTSLHGFAFHKDVRGQGIAVFPSFEVMVSGRKQFLTGYQTAEKIKSVAKELKAIK